MSETDNKTKWCELFIWLIVAGLSITFLILVIKATHEGKLKS
jgi:hypothetical protein